MAKKKGNSATFVTRLNPGALRVLDETAERLGLTRSDAIRALVPEHQGAPAAIERAARVSERSPAEAIGSIMEHGVRASLIEYQGIAPSELPLPEEEPGAVYEFAARLAAASSNSLAADLLVRLPDDERLAPADRGRLALAPRGPGGVTSGAATRSARIAGVSGGDPGHWSLPAAIHRGEVRGTLVQPVALQTLGQQVGKVDL